MWIINGSISCEHLREQEPIADITELILWCPLDLDGGWIQGVGAERALPCRLHRSYENSSKCKSELHEQCL